MNRKERRAARKTGQAGGLSQSFASQLRDMGDRQAQAGDVAQAESLYRQALASDPNDIVTLHRLGHLATRSGRIDEAFNLFNRSNIATVNTGRYGIASSSATTLTNPAISTPFGFARTFMGERQIQLAARFRF